jgi:hypothetical protein
MYNGDMTVLYSADTAVFYNGDMIMCVTEGSFTLQCRHNCVIEHKICALIFSTSLV